jgi:hypothetical protein
MVGHARIRGIITSTTLCSTCEGWLLTSGLRRTQRQLHFCHQPASSCSNFALLFLSLVSAFDPPESYQPWIDYQRILCTSLHRRVVFLRLCHGAVLVLVHDTTWNAHHTSLVSRPGSVYPPQSIVKAQISNLQFR